MLYLLDGGLVGNRRKMTLETLITDLEYADDMALLCNSWDDMTIMLRGLEGCFRDVGLTISCSRTKIMVVLPDGTLQPPEPISLRPGKVPVEVVSNFQYLGSVVSSDCSPTAEVESRIAKASQAFVPSVAFCGTRNALRPPPSCIYSILSLFPLCCMAWRVYC